MDFEDFEALSENELFSAKCKTYEQAMRLCEDAAEKANKDSVEWFYFRNLQRLFEQHCALSNALARKDDARRVENASAVLEMLRRVDMDALGADDKRHVYSARDYLCDVMGAKRK